MKDLRITLLVGLAIAFIISYCSRPKAEPTVSAFQYEELKLEFNNLQLAYAELQKEKSTPLTVGYVTTEEHEQIMNELLQCRLDKLAQETTKYVPPVRPRVVKTDTAYNVTVSELQTFYDAALDEAENRVNLLEVNLNECQTDLVEAQIKELQNNATKLVKGSITPEPNQIVNYTATIKGELIALDATIDILDFETLPTDLSPKITNHYIGVQIATVFDTEIRPMAALEYLSTKRKVAWGLSGGAQWTSRTNIMPHIGFKAGFQF